MAKPNLTHRPRTVELSPRYPITLGYEGGKMPEHVEASELVFQKRDYRRLEPVTVEKLHSR